MKGGKCLPRIKVVDFTSVPLISGIRHKGQIALPRSKGNFFTFISVNHLQLESFDLLRQLVNVFYDFVCWLFLLQGGDILAAFLFQLLEIVLDSPDPLLQVHPQKYASSVCVEVESLMTRLVLVQPLGLDETQELKVWQVQRELFRAPGSLQQELG